MVFFRHTCLRKAVAAECRGRDFVYTVRQPVLVLCYLLNLVYAEGWVREMAPARYFVPGEGSLCLLVSEKYSQKSE